VVINYQWSTLSFVRHLARIVAVLMLASFAAPAMACLLPGMTMTAAEHECCRRMAGQCGSMGMASSHSCCKVQAHSPNAFLKMSAVPTPVLPCVLTTPQVVDISATGSIWIGAIIDHPPPELSSVSTALRI